MSAVSIDSQSFRDWLQSQKAHAELIAVSTQAIDDYDSLNASNDKASELLDRLASATEHARFVVSEVALPLLSRIAVTSSEARQRIHVMSHSRKMEMRRRSIQYLNGLPREFCVDLLTRLLADKSARNREYAARKIECHDLKQLLPLLEVTISNETNQI